MYSFDGDYRRRPVQNYNTTQGNDRDSIIRKAHLERQRRTEQRLRNNGAIVLQSYARSFIYRQRKKREGRELFDKSMNITRDNLDDDKKLAFLLKQLIFFYSKSNEGDTKRLIDISQHMIRSPVKVLQNAITDPIWMHRIKKLLFICLEQLSVPNIPQAIPLRMIETFSSESSVCKYITAEEKLQTYLQKIYTYLTQRDYFEVIKHILDDKCPPLDGIPEHPPNQISEALFQMLIRPILLKNQDKNYMDRVCTSFARSILKPEFSEPIRFYILPGLAELKDFPFAELVSCLSTAADSVEKMQVDGEEEMPQLSPNILTTFVLNALLKLDKHHMNKLKDDKVLEGYIKVISIVSDNFLKLPKPTSEFLDRDDDSSDSEDNTNKIPAISVIERDCLQEIIEMLNYSNRVHVIVDNVVQCIQNAQVLFHLSRICHNLMIYNRMAVYDYKLLYTLSFKPQFLRGLWSTVTMESSQLGFQSPLSLLAKGVIPKTEVDMNRTIPFLATFCALFGRLVPTLHDGEFCQDDVLPGTPSEIMPFTVNELIMLSKTLKEISLGLVYLAFPETRSNINEHYRSVLGHSDSNEERNNQTKQIWSNLLKVVVYVLNQIHTRDLRKGFCPEGHWTVDKLNLPLDRPNDLPLRRNGRRGPRPFQPIRDFTREDLENGPPMSTKQIRSITILREIPFVVPFSTRVGILQGLLAADKLRVQGEFQDFLQGPSIQITVRRSHLYEDAYDRLRPENEHDLQPRFRVKFINNHGMDEAGIDGGGLFREFLTELIKTSFDPNRGFFMVTTDNKVYPNPAVGNIVEDFEKHYYFIGRILGKAIYENLLVELPLADFFLSKLAGKHSDVDVHQLASLDPELYKNLLSLKAYEGDVADLGLDFTVVTSDLGATTVEELCPNGQSTPVTKSNLIEYIQLMADYKLNKQIRRQCSAFRKGLSNVLPVQWLYMFSNKELQILISGAEIPIDLEDLKKHCRYGGEYNPNHPTIKCFWAVLESFSDLQKRQLLKFVTSCSRPPLLGFRDLDPPFCIQNAGDEERLPSASTCTNLLKLPSFKTVEQMKEKLLYAIQSGAGFELS